MTYLISFFISYLFGSIPTAYFVVKRTSNMDIRSVGSGNVGARNAFEVTEKKWVGIVVVLIDLFKGVAAVVGIQSNFGNDPAAVSVAMAGVVLGHCYPVWLKFKGGRGLATAAGVFLTLSWIWVPLWLILYFGIEKFSKNVHVSSVVSLLATPLVIFLIPDSIAQTLIPSYFSPAHFFAAGCVVVGVSISRHIDPLQKLAAENSSNE
ncbi:MAG: glycerol-3-phosphate acyltransferase [Bacteroidota bacterium]